jgi:hypothetical protein
MPIFRGTYYARIFQFKYENQQPIDITGWLFRSHFRLEKESNVELLELNSINGGWAVVDGPAGLAVMQLVADDTLQLQVTPKVWFDVLREDCDPGPIWMFEANVPVRDPITRDPPMEPKEGAV